MMVLRYILEESCTHKHEVHLIFIDYQKAFNINNALLLSILNSYDIKDDLNYTI